MIDAYNWMNAMPEEDKPASAEHTANWFANARKYGIQQPPSLILLP
jgi:hypothetical protein